MAGIYTDTIIHRYESGTVPKDYKGSSLTTGHECGADLLTGGGEDCKRRIPKTNKRKF